MEVFALNNIKINSFSKIKLGNALKEILSGQKNPQLIITLNLDFLRIAEKNMDFLHVCNNSLWNLPDGNGITTLLKIKYSQNAERITGNDLFPMLLDIANQQLYKVALIGSSDIVLSKVKDLISKKYQKIAENLLCISPPLNFEKDPKLNSKIVNEVTEFKPDIVFAALGCPRQELWLWENMNQFKSKINVGVGAVFDFYSGVKKRSPVLFQKMYMEWFWRLLNEPGRLFKRYIILDMPFFIKVSIKILFTRISSRSNVST